MKIAWFTPFNKKSAIGKYSKLATDALSNYADVDIFSSNRDDLLETNLNIIDFNYEDKRFIESLEQYDIYIYNIGDNSEYHSEIYEVSTIKKGIIICHDATLLGFFKGYYCIFKNEPQRFVEMFEKTYNISASESDKIYLSDNSLDYGMLEIIAQRCLGIIVHSDFHNKLLKNKYCGPIKTIYFPFRQEYINSNEKLGNVNINKEKINLLTVGNVNKNKRVYEVVEAISKSNILRDRIKYLVVGSQSNIQYVERIKKLIRENKLEENVKLIDYVTDEELADYYKNADLISNLRNPAIEGASWSLVEQMSLGKPIIVSDNGFYSEIPEECVLKISLENEQKELIEKLEEFVKNQQDMIHMKENVIKFVEEQFSPKRYAQSLVEFMKEIKYNKPLEMLVSEISLILNSLEVVEDMEIIDSISREMEAIFYKIK